MKISIIKCWKGGRITEGSNRTYINDLFMEQSDHNLPPLCDLPVKVGDDSGREEKTEWQTHLPVFGRLWIITGCKGTVLFA